MKHIHSSISGLSAPRPRYFLAAGVVCLCCSVFSLRANNEHMIKLRDTLYAADKNDDHVEQSLRNLQAYVTAHMNTNLSSGPNAVYPPIQLKYTYDRIVKAESDQLSQTNTAFYTEAQHYCEQQDSTDYYGYYRIGCIENYLQSHDTQHQIAPVADSLYKFDFVSPRWSPDLAGWSVVATISMAAACAISWLHQLRRKH